MKTTISNPAERAKLVEHIHALNLEGRPWQIEIKRVRAKPKTMSQLALYYMWVGIAAEDTGHWKDDMDEILREQCSAPRHSYTDFEGVEQWRYSLKEADTAEMSAYINRVDIFLTSDLGLQLPHPEDMQRMW